MWKANRRTDNGRLPMTTAHLAYGLTQIFYDPVNFEIVRFDYIHEKNQFYVKNMTILIHSKKFESIEIHI
jgi:hypothetical protein